MKHIVLVLGFLGVFVPVYAQQGTIKGTVTSKDRNPEFAHVTIAGTNLGTVVNTDGSYILKNIPAGDHTLRFSAMGFYQKDVKIKIQGGETLTIHAELNLNEQLLNEVVVTGTMKEMSKAESPVPVEIYTPKFFKKNPTPNLFEALQVVNGVRPQLNCNICNTGDIHINGMEGPYTMVLIDGMPIVSSLSTVYGLSGIPNSIVERIEIVKGPASTLYGSEAVGGLINVITKSPLNTPAIHVDVSATTYHEYNTDLAFKFNVSKKITSMFSTNYFKFDKRWDLNDDHFTDVTMQDRISIFNKWNFQRKDERINSIAARYVYEDRWGGELNWNKSFRGGDSVYGESIYTRRYELIGVYQLPVREKLMFNYSLTDHHQNSYYGTVPYMADQQIAFSQFTWDKRLNARNDLLVGAALRYIYYDDNTPATQNNDTLNIRNQPERTLLPGIFVQDEISLTEYHKLLLGLRYDHHSVHGNIVTPRVNYKYTDRRHLNTIRVSLGNGYRVVNLFTEDHAALTGAREVVINEELEPERSYNANVNYQRFINMSNGFISFDATVFYTYFTNRINGDYQTDPQKIIYDNLDGYAVSQGFSLNTDINFSFPLKLLLGFTCMDVYQMENNRKIPQVYASDFSGNFLISYQIHRWNMSVDYTGNVYGPMPLPVVPNDYRPSMSPWYSIQNIQLTKKIKNWELYGGVKNLLDFMPQDPILRPFDPFDKNVEVDNPYGYTFDPGYLYASMQGIRGFMGVRVSF